METEWSSFSFFMYGKDTFMNTKNIRMITWFVMCFICFFSQVSIVSAKDVLPSGSYQISHIPNDVLMMNQNIQLSTLDNGNSQKWDIINRGDGTFLIKNQASQQVLTYTKKNVQMKEADDSKKQQWIIEKVDGHYQVTSQANKKYTLGVNGQTVCAMKAEKAEWNIEATTTWTGPVLSASAGSIEGPSGKETYYNLDMSGVVANLKAHGVQGDYWERADGAKMYGAYVMVAAHLGIRPYGTLIPTSLGMGIVCDTGSFAQNNATQLDVATNW